MSRPSERPPIYDASVLESSPAFAIEPPDQELAERAAAAGWPDGFLDRVLALRRNRAEILALLDACTTANSLERQPGLRCPDE